MRNGTCMYVCIVFSVCQCCAFSFSEQWKHTISTLSTPSCRRGRPSNRRATTTFTAALKTTCCWAPSQVVFFFFYYSDALILSLCSSFVGFLKIYWIALTCKKRKKKSSNAAWKQTKRGWGIGRKFSLKTRSCHSDKLCRTLVFPRSPHMYTKTIPFSTLLCWQSKRILSAWLTDALRVHHTRRHEKQQSSHQHSPNGPMASKLKDNTQKNPLQWKWC